MKNTYYANIDEISDFKELVSRLDKTGIGFLALTNKEMKLLGIITDGDIRRAILNGKMEVKDIINKTPIILPYTTSRHDIISKLNEKRKRHVPLIDENGILKEIFALNDFNDFDKNNVVVIMAGGLGKRLGDLTKEIPKPMLRVKGKPILEYIVNSFKEQGFHKFIFCVNFKSEVIKEYFKDRASFNVEITYVKEDKRLGTAGALSLIDKQLLQEPFFVVNGDVIANVDFNELLDFYHKKSAEAVMCVKRMSYTNPYAEVLFDDANSLVELKEKPTSRFYINSGIYLLNKEAVNHLPHNEFYDMPDLFLKLKEDRSQVKVYTIDDDWIDIGLPKDYYRITE